MLLTIAIPVALGAERVQLNVILSDAAYVPASRHGTLGQKPPLRLPTDQPPPTQDRLPTPTRERGRRRVPDSVYESGLSGRYRLKA